MTKRREFIRKSVLGTAGIAIGGLGFSRSSYNSIIGSNDRISVAVVGIRSQGGTHINSFCSLKDTKNVRLKTICDADEQFFAPSIKTILDLGCEKPVTEWDMRKVFDDKEVDAVSFATPDHWHALGTIWACQAGKHVYVEKPTSHTIFEGRQMIEASKKFKVRVQTGLMNRSIPKVMAALKFIHDGGIGEIYMAKGLCYKPRDSFGIAKDGTPPESLHYETWVGPAQLRAYNEKRVHYNWHWFWNTGGGDAANQGPHQFDIARWGMGKNEHPVKIYSMGGLYGINPAECEQETPNTLTSVFKYSDGKILEFETRGRFTNAESTLDVRIGNIFYGTEGYLELLGDGDRDWRAFRHRETKPFAGSEALIKTDVANAPPVESEHYANFIDAIRSGRDEDMRCSITDGHLSSSLPMLGNIAYLVGREITFDGTKEKFVKDPEADKLLTREYRKPYILPDLK